MIRPLAPAPDWRFRLAILLPILLVLTLYWQRAGLVASELGNTDAAGAYYNRLIDGFAAGQLNLKVPIPPGLARLPDPWDPDANAAFRGRLYTPNRLHDTTYYHGKIYLYFGVVPALLLFWPYHLLTGGYLYHHQAVALGCSVGFLVSVWLLCRLRRRFFPAAGPWLLAGCTLALGLATSVPEMLWRADVWEIPIACGYGLGMLTFLSLWQALDHPARRGRWLAVAGAMFGLAVGARPSLLLAAPLLLVPVLPWFDRGSNIAVPFGARLRWLLATLVPLALIGAGLAWYNYARFGNIFEFGQSYQLAGTHEDRLAHYHPRFVWFNFRLYFLQPAQWDFRLPFLPEIAIPPLPDGHGLVERPNGLLVNTPVVLAALVLPFVWSGFGGADRAGLRRLVAALAFSALASATLFCFFFGTCLRYQVEFQPALVLLAAIGACAVAQHLAGSPRLRRWLGGLWFALLAYSVAFGLLRDRSIPATHDWLQGMIQMDSGHAESALPHLWKVLAYDPRSVPALYELGTAYFELNRPAEAVAPLEAGLGVDPDYPPLHILFGRVLWQLNRPSEAITHFERGVALDPQNVRALRDLASLLRQVGRLDEARAREEEAARLAPAVLQFSR